MDIYNINNPVELKRILKKVMIILKNDIVTNTKTYKKGEWFFIQKMKNSFFLYDEDPRIGVELTFDEADNYIYWGEDIYGDDWESAPPEKNILKKR